jgi:hypothetical protein
MTQSEAFRKGYAAYEADLEVWQNDYSEGEQAEDWREGWLAAAAEHEREHDMNERDKVLDGRGG